MNEEIAQHYMERYCVEIEHIGGQLRRIADCLERAEASESVAPKKKEPLIPWPLALWMIFCMSLSVLAVLATWGGK
jgi:hypothetical protein